ncbi:MAG TPA: hypothetical protein VM621_07475 [Luteibacter sp.]|uniref:pilus assembly FimT family protein n=1 Tax=Luteibacter sp. TaxID=1886636 RepID=UPI002C15D7EA|nr:hypothetical protein [Luteibacter sp.]HVI54876.1 hypothetical protein [Luteibacter sp.]
MAADAVRPRGHTLVELAIGLCVASIVALMATTSLMTAGLVLRHHLTTRRTEDDAWLALAAIARDLEAAKTWGMCSEARDCPRKSLSHEYNVPALLAGEVGWLVADELRRCTRSCTTFVAGVASLEVMADLRGADGLTDRRPFLQWHGDRAHALEVIVTMRDRRRFSRVVSRPTDDQ